MRLCPKHAFEGVSSAIPVFARCRANNCRQKTRCSVQHSDLDDHPAYILEIGAATSGTTTGGSATFAPNLPPKERLSNTGWNLKQACPPSSLATPRGGTPIFYSKALDTLEQSGVHAWRWAAMGLLQAERALLQHADGRGGRGLHVLADRKASFRLVSRTGVRLQLC